MSHGQDMNRRDFIKISSLFLAGSAAMSTQIGRTFSGTGNALAGEHAEKVVHSFCEHCFWRCGIAAHVRDGRIYKITGSEHHPLSNGKLCPRGTGGIGQIYDPDRLAHPLIRERKGGQSTYRKATWDEAITLTAEKLYQIKEKYGPQAIAMLHHGYGYTFFKEMFKSFGVNKFAKPSFDFCCGPRHQGYILTYGHSAGTPEGIDIQNSKYVIFFGTHYGENMHNTAVQEISEGIRRGLKIVVFDPRFSTLAGKAEKWLPIKAGTDIAMMQAMMNVLITENLYDKQFVEENTVGFDELWAEVREMTPEKAAEITDIPAEDIRDVARRFASFAPSAAVHPGRRTQWYADGTQRVRCIAILNALVGNYKMPGGVVKYEKYKLPKAPHHHYPEFEKEIWSQYPLFTDIKPSNTMASHEVMQQTMNDEIKAWFVYGVNVPETVTLGRKATLEAIDKVDFLVAVDTLPMEVTGYADVVLPECTYLERYDDLDGGRPYRTPFVALRQPAVEPMFDSKPGNEIARMLADKLDLHGVFEDSVEEYLDKRLKAAGSSLEEVKKTGVLLGEPTDLYRKPGEKLTFKTPSGKIELASSKMREAGFSAVPKYIKHPEAPEGYYRILTGRKPMLTFGRTANNRFLNELPTARENDIWVNPEVAKQHGLTHGEYVHLKNQAGVVSEFPIRVKVTERIRKDAVYMVHGYGHYFKKLNWAYKRGASHNQLISQTEIDKAIGAVGFQNNFVTFIKEA
ncbi:molybdopterin-dependent oxidoreductase [Prosthecochloris sp. N3]|uniref:Molybdopterin-dependent oxidoreductase n=2 Tax=Chlorobiaceae TaxID=191412 RepID=A0ABR9XTI0_9CHLB|nr:molybdopterin-dependent oxidoreductase [Prosthecochloris ethylica]MBF0637311.1 molybdopterin-dependent oxidoreductase [Prosthecochloris ethylica]NUK48400.1 molybdopterin-dependent oxidoreductase [Prosthecochloris ethylica]RNA65915.1 formate dehydrogenase [Prosthecochloris sp. ZM_2]